MLSAMTAVIGNIHHAEAMAGWKEYAILFVALVGCPEVCKSHPLSYVMQPLIDHDAEKAAQFAEALKRYNAAMELPPKERIANGYDLNPADPCRVRFMMQDVTNKAVHRILSENRRGLILMYDELAGWVKNFNRYNNGSESEFWMSVLNHKVAISDRKGSQSGVFIRNPFLCVIGTIQPKVLTDLAAGNRNANGFMERILYVFPSDQTLRTKPKNGPQLSADDIMPRENLTRFPDTYAEAMARFELERGIRGSEARHVDQHEYYRQCQIKKKDLEQDVATLSSEKKQLDTKTQSLEKRKKELEHGNRWMDKAFADTKAANAEITRQNGELEKRKSELVKSNPSLTATNTSLTAEKKALEADKSRLIAEHTTCAKEAETARKEKETALQEAAEAKSQRDANHKDALSNLANRFTGNKTKRLETELAPKSGRSQDFERTDRSSFQDP